MWTHLLYTPAPLFSSSERINVFITGASTLPKNLPADWKTKHTHSNDNSLITAYECSISTVKVIWLFKVQEENWTLKLEITQFWVFSLVSFANMNSWRRTPNIFQIRKCYQRKCTNKLLQRQFQEFLGARFSNVPVTFRARSYILKSKSIEWWCSF